MGFSILSVFALQLSLVLAAAVRSPPPYYGPISPNHRSSKHEPEKFAFNVAFENFREAELEPLGNSVSEVLSQVVPVALTAAIKKEDPYRILADIGDDGWNVVQLTLVRISSILYRDDLSFVGGSGGVDSSELWENVCRDGKTGASIWHGYKASDGSMEGSNTIAICPSFFQKQWKRVQEYDCEDMGIQKLMELRSAILLRELAQTSHAGVGLRHHDSPPAQEAAENQPAGAQKVLKTTSTEMRSEQVDVELFNLYAILAWRRSICDQRDEKYPQFDWMHSER